MIYSANEIVTLAGGNPDETLGKVSVRIGGLPVNRKDQLVNLQDAKTVTVVIGAETKDIELPTQEEISDEVKAIKEAQGQVSAEKAETAMAAKKDEGEVN